VALSRQLGRQPVEEADAFRDRGRLDAARDSELAQDVGDMRASGLAADEECLGDAGVGVPVRHEPEHLELEVESAVTGTTRRYERLADLERDTVDARVYVGYHWRTSNEVGYRLGERVARWSLERHFQPN
jgi:hypothetical protein